MSTSSNDKRAALELHALGAPDREWVLGRLPPGERARVLPLLAELDGMGIRFDLEGAGPPADDAPGARDDAPAAPAGASSFAPPSPFPSGFPSPQAVVRDASPADVVRALAGEPEWLVRAALALAPWPWLAPVRRALEEEGLRVPSTTRPGEPSLPPGLSAALLAQLAARLHDPAGAGRVNGRHNGHHNGAHRLLAGGNAWGRVWPRVRQWLP